MVRFPPNYGILDGIAVSVRIYFDFSVPNTDTSELFPIKLSKVSFVFQQAGSLLVSLPVSRAKGVVLSFVGGRWGSLLG